MFEDVSERTLYDVTCVVKKFGRHIKKSLDLAYRHAHNYYTEDDMSKTNHKRWALSGGAAEVAA